MHKFDEYSHSFFQELNQRAQGEVTIREALKELNLWGASTVFALTKYEDSHKHQMNLIKDWKDLINAVSGMNTLHQHTSFNAFLCEMIATEFISPIPLNFYLCEIIRWESILFYSSPSNQLLMDEICLIERKIPYFSCCHIGGRQPVPALLPQRFPVLRPLRGQSLSVGDSAGRA